MNELDKKQFNIDIKNIHTLSEKYWEIFHNSLDKDDFYDTVPNIDIDFRLNALKDISEDILNSITETPDISAEGQRPSAVKTNQQTTE